MKLIKKILKKVFRKKFIKNFRKFCNEKNGHALLYYKTDYFLFNGALEDRSHTNEWESYEIARILNKLGFWVDIADRTINLKDIEKIKDKYEIFIGIGAGDSGRYFKNIASKLNSAVRVLYALGPEPNLSNKITKERHNFFLQRHPGTDIEVRRLIKEVDIDDSIRFVDAIITNCNEWGIEGYKKFEKAIKRVWLSSYPKLNSSCNEIFKKDQKKFMYFGGNGNITKGLDLIIESFVNLPELELYIGAPKSEEDFNLIYKPILEKAKNIHFIGFMDVKSNLYRKITSECGYVILPSSSEGCATSVTTCMRRGLIPVVTKEAGVDIGNFGYNIEDININKIEERVREIANSNREEFIKRSFGAYIESFKYTQANFSFTFERALLETILDNKIYAK
ncbi:MAG TPA: glycosyltransferase [Candidatus Paceibacterota bacterium]|nr:glycosyltransferase [Candidatus Paceibacterota bacterium]